MDRELVGTAAPGGAAVWGAAAALLLATLVGLLSWSVRPPPAPPAVTGGAPVRAGAGAPLAFVRNVGQAPKAVHYTAHAARHTVAIFADGIGFVAAGGATAQLRFEGARTAGRFTEREPLAARAHWLRGTDAATWQRDVPMAGQLRQAGLYRGIDLVHYSRGGDYEFDFVVHPGADASQIRLRHTGPKPALIDAEGRLRLDGADGVLAIPHPVTVQQVDGRRVTRDARWRLDADGTIGLELPEHDRSRVLVIDPVFKLLYSSYVGGVHDDQVGNLVLDVQGNAYVVGFSGSEDWPVAGNAWQRSRKALGSYVRNVVVSKFDTAGTLLWSTFLGGSVNDYGQGIAVDAAGQVVVSGYTNSPDFPTSADALQRTLSGGQSAFLAVLSPDGSNLVHATLYGGSGGAQAFDIALDGAGRLWAVGWAGSGLPTTAGSYKPTLAGAGSAAYVARFSTTTAPPLRLEAATYYGIDNAPADRFFTGNTAYALAFAPGGGVWIAGQARHERLPSTADALQAAPTAIDHDAQVGALPLCAFGYVARLAADLRTLEYASYLTGYTREARDRSSCAEYARSIAVASNGDVLVGGSTASDRFPTTTGAPQAAYPGAGGFVGHSGFATRLRADGRSLAWSTYVGGNGGDSFVNGLTFDAVSNAAWLFGVTSGGTNFPLSTDAQQASFGGGTYDAGLVRLHADTGALLYGTYAGGSGNDNPTALRADAAGNVVLAGGTDSRNFPVTPDAFQAAYTANAFDGADIFLRLLGNGSIAQVTPARVGNGGDVTIGVRGAGLVAGARAFLVDGAVSVEANGPVQMGAGGHFIAAVFSLAGQPAGVYDLVLRNPDGSELRRTAGVTVTAAPVGPQLALSSTGRTTIRVGTPSTLQLALTNTGDTDAYFAVVRVAVPVQFQARFRLAALPPAFAGDSTDYTTITGTEVRDGVGYTLLLVPQVPAGRTATISVDITATDALPGAVEAELLPSYVGSMAEVEQMFANAARPAGAAGSGRRHAMLTSAQAVKCGSDIIILGAGAVGAAAGLGTGAVAAAAGAVLAGTVASGFVSAAEFASGGKPTTVQASMVDAAQNAASSFLPNIAQNVLSAFNIAEDCDPDHKFRDAAWDRIKHLFEPKFSVDPNDKTGPMGDGSAQHHIAAPPQLAYQVAFENKASASLPAAEVVITDRLDPATMDLDSVRLGAITWGPYAADVPAGTDALSTTVALGSTLSVRIAGSLDRTTGVLKWTFTTLDPATRLPPSDPTLGFLPPNANGTEGQGYVNFTVRPKAGLADGTRWENKASIVFDANAPIETPTWVNTLDTTPPTSRVTTATAKAGSGDIDVAWSGDDAGAGVRGYTLWVSEDGGAFAVWQRDVATTAATYAGAVGRRYAFYAIATDGAGNVEGAKTAGEAGATAGSPGESGGGGGGGGCTIARPGQADGTLVLLLGAAVVAAWRRRAAERR